MERRVTPLPRRRKISAILQKTTSSAKSKKRSSVAGLRTVAFAVLVGCCSGSLPASRLCHLPAARLPPRKLALIPLLRLPSSHASSRLTTAARAHSDILSPRTRLAFRGRFHAAAPEEIGSYAADCTTPKTDFNVGDIACAKVSGTLFGLSRFTGSAPRARRTGRFHRRFRALVHPHGDGARRLEAVPRLARRLAEEGIPLLRQGRGGPVGRPDGRQQPSARPDLRRRRECPLQGHSHEQRAGRRGQRGVDRDGPERPDLRLGDRATPAAPPARTRHRGHLQRGESGRQERSPTLSPIREHTPVGTDIANTAAVTTTTDDYISATTLRPLRLCQRDGDRHRLVLECPNDRSLPRTRLMTLTGKANDPIPGAVVNSGRRAFCSCGAVTASPTSGTFSPSHDDGLLLPRRRRHVQLKVLSSRGPARPSPARDVTTSPTLRATVYPHADGQRGRDRDRRAQRRPAARRPYGAGATSISYGHRRRGGASPPAPDRHGQRQRHHARPSRRPPTDASDRARREPAPHRHEAALGHPGRGRGCSVTISRTVVPAGSFFPVGRRPSPGRRPTRPANGDRHATVTITETTPPAIRARRTRSTPSR